MARTPKLKRLTTVSDVIEAVGGAAELAELATTREEEVKADTVSDWKCRAKKIPCRFWPVVHAEMRERGFDVPLDLFSFRKPDRERRHAA